MQPMSLDWAKSSLRAVRGTLYWKWTSFDSSIVKIKTLNFRRIIKDITNKWCITGRVRCIEEDRIGKHTIESCFCSDSVLYIKLDGAQIRKTGYRTKIDLANVFWTKAKFSRTDKTGLRPNIN